MASTEDTYPVNESKFDVVSRRRVLRASAAALAASGGCITGLTSGDRTAGDRTAVDTTTGDTEPSDPASPPSPGRVDPEKRCGATAIQPGDVPHWPSDWTLSFEEDRVLGLDADEGHLYATLSRDGGPSAVALVEPAEDAVAWRTEFDGEAVARSHANRRPNDHAGVTLTDDAVYAVAGRVDDRLWTALHALDRTSGERRWSVRRERRLGVAGVRAGLVIATGREFFPPPGETPVGHETPDAPLTTVVYGVDADDGTVRWTREFADVRDVSVGTEGIFVGVGDRLVGLTLAGETRFVYERGPATRVAATADRVFYLAGEDEAATIHGLTLAGEAAWRHDATVDGMRRDGDRLYATGTETVAIDADGAVAWRSDCYGGWPLPDPDGDLLYTRTGGGEVPAFDGIGRARWLFDPPADNAWPTATTGEALVVTAITNESGGPFKTAYAVDDDGRATAANGVADVYDVATLGGTVYVSEYDPDGGSVLVALDPRTPLSD